MNVLETDRLLLRNWKEADLEPFYQMNSDPEVMKFFPSLLDKQQSNDLANALKKMITETGWGLWAVERKEDAAFIGFVGLHSPKTKFSFAPCIEVGWRLAKKYWGFGYATEAGAESLNFAFTKLQAQEIVSFTSVLNKPSVAVMKRLGLVNTQSNFFHPNIPPNNPLCEHLLYKITAIRFLERL